EVEVSAEHAGPLAEAWERHLRPLCREIGWREPRATAVRIYDGGVSLAFEAPIDMLYAATEINETAVGAAIASLGGDAAAALDGVGEMSLPEDLILSRLDELNDRLLAIERAADARGHVFLWDDDEASVGLGTGSVTWPVSALPSPEAVDWDAVHGIPTCIITGTNGKSTTSRMMSAIVRASGAVPGATSTDGVMVGDEWVERGDYSGPGGARTALRDRRVEVGVLEVARGGILRRGLGLPQATAVAVTNVDEDHLGDYGINTVPQLAEVKFVVAKALASGGALVTNYDDAHCRREVERIAGPLAQRGAHLVWTGLSPEALPDGPAVSVVDGWVVRRAGSGGGWIRVVEVAEIPSAMGGAAKYNVRNALTACGLAHALGLDGGAIARGLMAFV
ncbi:MAG: Mur ligase family protein, partial [Bacteroidota bacterium]